MSQEAERALQIKMLDLSLVVMAWRECSHVLFPMIPKASFSSNSWVSAQFVMEWRECSHFLSPMTLYEYQL